MTLTTDRDGHASNRQSLARLRPDQRLVPEPGGARLGPLGAEMIVRTDAYLRVPLGRFGGRSLAIYVELAAPLNTVNFRSYQDNYYVVLGGSPNPQDIRNPNNDRGASSFDQRFNSTTSFVYDLPLGRGRRFGGSMPKPKTEPVPKGLDWDLWIGPAPWRPYNDVYFPGPKWYRWWDFGNGTMSDLGSHWIDLPFWALKLDHPLSIEAGGPPAHPEIAPASMRATYQYGARGDLPPVQLTWYQGNCKPERLKERKVPEWDSGVLFVGEKGMVLSDYGRHVLLPEEQFKNFKRPDPFIPASLGHHAEWIHACKTGAPTTCNFQYAGWLTEANHLGNVAYRVGKRIEWDADSLQVTNAPEAASYIRREYRKPWKLV